MQIATLPSVARNDHKGLSQILTIEILRISIVRIYYFNPSNDHFFLPSCPLPLAPYPLPDCLLT